MYQSLATLTACANFSLSNLVPAAESSGIFSISSDVKQQAIFF